MPKLCNNMYNNYYGEEFNYYYPYSFHNEDVSYLFSINPCKVEIPLGNNYEIPIDIDSYILVNDGDIVYYISGEDPNTGTEAEIGAKAYNVVDLISWELKNIVNNNSTYMWRRDEVFTFSANSKNVVELPEAYYENKKFNISFFNFRYELIYSTEQDAHKETHFNLTKEIADEYFNFKGLYYMQVDLIDESTGSKNTIILPSTFVIAII